MTSYQFLVGQLFKVLADKLVSRTTENREVSSAKSLGFDDNLIGKSLMQIKSNNGSRIKPCGTPALTAAHLETCPFKTTL